MPAINGRTRRSPTSVSPDTPANVRSAVYHPNPSVGPNPCSGARPKLKPNALPAVTSSSNGNTPPTDPPTPPRLTMLGRPWADAVAAVITQASNTHSRTRFLIADPLLGSE